MKKTTNSIKRVLLAISRSNLIHFIIALCIIGVNLTNVMPIEAYKLLSLYLCYELILNNANSVYYMTAEEFDDLNNLKQEKGE